MRAKYLTVESINPGERGGRRRGGREVRGGEGNVEVGGAVTRGSIVTEENSDLRRVAGTKVQRPISRYSFIFVKVMSSLDCDRGSCYVLFLIFVAKRFNTAYYLVLNTGQLVRW